MTDNTSDFHTTSLFFEEFKMFRMDMYARDITPQYLTSTHWANALVAFGWCETTSEGRYLMEDYDASSLDPISNWDQHTHGDVIGPVERIREPTLITFPESQPAQIQETHADIQPERRSRRSQSVSSSSVATIQLE